MASSCDGILSISLAAAIAKVNNCNCVDDDDDDYDDCINHTINCITILGIWIDIIYYTLNLSLIR